MGRRAHTRTPLRQAMLQTMERKAVYARRKAITGPVPGLINKGKEQKCREPRL